MLRWLGLGLIASGTVALAAACGGSGDVGSGGDASGDGGFTSSAGTSSDHGPGNTSSSSGLMFDGGGCTPATCDTLGVDCGDQSDGCGKTIHCGGCPQGQVCGGGGPSICGEGACTPLTCEQLNASCGMQGDGCNHLIDCGTCTDPQTCGGGSVPNACGSPDGSCTPKSCADQGIDCGPAADGCGALVMCGDCQTAGEFCGGGGPNKCGTNIPPCTKLTCADAAADCGPISDGCGGLTASCGDCTGGNCCGCGGDANKCGGAPPACVAKTCADLGADCGKASDGCGGLTPDCGGCTGGNCCGCGGDANKCGGAPTCTALKCSDFPSGTCGQQSDGCGGLTANCGTCTGTDYCGGGGPNKCGSTAQCVNLQCKQVTCPGSGTTSISGTVYDPAGKNPLPNVNVYVPNGTVAALSNGAHCDQCDTALSGNPLVTTITDAKGHFKLTNMPVDANVPVVVQIGKWRRQLNVTTTSCGDVPLTINQVRLPRNKSEGNIPKIALSTGGYDTLECLLRKIGIDDAEFTNPAGTGRVNLYAGSPTTLDANGLEAAFEYDSTHNGGAKFPKSTTLWATKASLQQYDVTLLSCEGDTHTETKTSANLKAMFDYVNDGGRVFASHYHHYWVSGNSNGTGTAAWGTLASWIYPSPGMVLQSNHNSITIPETVVQTFPKGSLMANWLVTVGGSATPGNLTITDTKNSVKTFDASRVLEWIYTSQGALCTKYNIFGSCTQVTNIPHATQYMTFNAPVENAAGAQCGRFVFSDIHVGSDEPGGDFPSGCTSGAMTAQEKALEFMFFDLSSAVCDEMQPPPTCTPITCADQGIQCGPAPDGCGGTIASCGTCTGGLVCSTGGQCAGGSCTKKTCNQLGHDCGSWSDGCGGTLNCGTCTGAESCGGGGTPGTCGAGSCTKATCNSLGYDCGQWSDGCGSTINCGTCTTPESCGGGGTQGHCGGNGCTPKTCAQLGVLCGPSGDGCGNVIDCGMCMNPQCTPLACGGRCGPQGDGCGGIITCEACPPGSCVPTTCLKAGAQCGFFPDGCGSGLMCGTCSAGEQCDNNKCVGIH